MTYYDIDWQGACQIRKLMPAAKEHLHPTTVKELERRLNTRGQDSEAVIARRMQEARSEISHFDEYDYIIVNDDFDVALIDFKQLFVQND